MGQSLSAIYIHAVFRTKFGKPWIDQTIENDLHAYIAAILKKLDSPALKINSMPDHIHILFRLSKNQSLSYIMQIIKKDSSKWMKSKGYGQFRWQIGYGAFSVSSSGIQAVTKYIINQKQHHKKKSHKQEVETLMDKYDLEEYCNEYYWK